MGQTKAAGFQVGDIVTRDGTDRQRVISTNQEDPRYAADLIEVECIQAPLGYLEEDGVTRGEPWCKVGDREENIARRYTYADEAVDIEQNHPWPLGLPGEYRRALAERRTVLAVDPGVEMGTALAGQMVNAAGEVVFDYFAEFGLRRATLTVDHRDFRERLKDMLAEFGKNPPKFEFMTTSPPCQSVSTRTGRLTRLIFSKDRRQRKRGQRLMRRLYPNVTAGRPWRLK